VKKVFKPEAGQWVPLRGKVNVVCCDCKLTHVYEFRVDDTGLLYMRGWRDNRATANRRRSLKRAKI
jgi:hypothetical protein